MVMVLKKGLYFTLNFKGLFSCILIVCLIVSFVLFVASPGEIRTASSENVSQYNVQKHLIIVDPGHGGEDGGTVSSKGVLS